LFRYELQLFRLLFSCETAYRSMFDRPDPPNEESIRFNAEECISKSLALDERNATVSHHQMMV
jgi:hypothetical protein